MRINVLPVIRPDASLEAHIEDVDGKLSQREQQIFAQVCSTMKMQ